MTRTFGLFARLNAGAVLICACAGCARDRQMQHAVPGPIAAQSATSVGSPVSYSANPETTIPAAAPGSFGGSGQTPVQTSSTQSAPPTDSSPAAIVTPSRDGRMFSSPSSCSKPGCNSCRN